MAIHTMMTRSKKKSLPPPDDVDERGNLVGLIDYDCEEGFDRDSLNQQLSLLSRGRIQLDTNCLLYTSPSPRDH